MKKEKTVRAYKRKTKSGKVVNVKQHTAKYDAAEEFKKAMKKKGAGDELERKLTDKELKQVESIISENSELDPEYLAAFYPELSTRMIKEVMHQYRKKSAVPTPAARAKAEKLPKSAPALNSDTISKEDYKAWYNWDMVDDPKNEAALRVKKALTKKMGAKGYAAYEKEMSDKWSARGHAKAYAALNKDAVADKTPKSLSGSANLSKEELAELRNYYATDVKAKRRGVYVYTTMDEGEKKTATAAQLRKMMRDFDAKPSTRAAMVAAKADKLAKKDMDFLRKKASKK